MPQPAELWAFIQQRINHREDTAVRFLFKVNEAKLSFLDLSFHFYKPTF